MTPLLPLRRTVFYLSLFGLAVSLASAFWLGVGLWAVAIFAPLSALGLYDIIQRRRTLNRIYPILIHFRYFLESIGAELRQYLIESDQDEVPFSREQRQLVYRRAKNVLDKRPFGTQLDVYETGYEWINHSLKPLEPSTHDFRVEVGGACAKPYSASVFNISAMSFGSISPNAVRALNAGAARGGFYHDTGEGSISRYHREGGGDLVWEIGSGYFGCRDGKGRFDESKFIDNAALDQVKMIEIKLSQGAKPGQGGVLPGPKVNAEIAEARGVPIGEDVISPATHSAFTGPREMLDFIDRLRELSGGKPVGFKLAFGHPWEWFDIVKAMHQSGQCPDFIVVDGGEGGTGAATLEFVNRVGMPMRDALMLAHNSLVGVNLRDRIRVGAAGKITSSFMIAHTMALGADWCNAARAFMFSLGCIQAQSCHTDRCPSGVATQDPNRWQKMDVADKSERVYHFHRNTLIALSNLIAAVGLRDPSELKPEHIMRRVSETDVRSYASVYPRLSPGELLEDRPRTGPFIGW